MRKILIPLSILIFALSLFAEEKKYRIAVMELNDQTTFLSEALLETAAEYLRSELVSSNQFLVVPKDRQKQVLIKEEKKKSWKDCYDQTCRIELGQALSADTILVGTITRFADPYVLTLELIDLAKEVTVKGGRSEFDGSEDGLKIAIVNSLLQLGVKRRILMKEEYRPYLWPGVGLIIGGVVLGIAGGIGFGLEAERNFDNYDRKMDPIVIQAAQKAGVSETAYIQSANNIHDKAVNYAGLEYASIALGGLAIITGAVLLFPTETREVMKQVRIDIGPRGIVLAASFSF